MGKPHVRDCTGGGRVTGIPTAEAFKLAELCGIAVPGIVGIAPRIVFPEFVRNSCPRSAVPSLECPVFRGKVSRSYWVYLSFTKSRVFLTEFSMFGIN